MSVIGDVFLRYMIPVTAGTAVTLFAAHYGVGKCIKIIGAAIYSLGDGVEVAWAEGKRTARRTFASAKEDIYYAAR